MVLKPQIVKSKIDEFVKIQNPKCGDPKSKTQNREYNNSKSFLLKTRIVLVLLGILPFLIVVYLFRYGNIDVTDTVVIFSALARFSILTGFMFDKNSLY